MNILVVTRDRVTYLILREFLEEKGDQVFDSKTLTAKEIEKMVKSENIELLLIDLFLKEEEHNYEEDSTFTSVKFANNILKTDKNIKVAFMTNEVNLNNSIFHNKFKDIDQNWLLIHKSDISFLKDRDCFYNQILQLAPSATPNIKYA